MRLLFVIDHLSSGGAQGQMTLLAQELVLRGHEIEFFTYHHETFHRERLVRANIKIHHHPKRSRYSVNTLLNLKKLVKAGEFDLILSFLTTPNIYSVLARGKSKSPAVVISERSSSNNPLQKKYGRIRTFITNQIYQQADHLCVNSHHLREAHIESQSWDDRRVSTIWNGVDLERFAFHELSVDKPLRILAIGRIAEYKNAARLIKGLGILHDRFGIEPKVSWLARRFPNLTLDEQEHKKMLDELIQENQLQDRWKWLPEQQDIRDIVRDHHVLIHPSLVEGLPNAVCESLAMGRPVLISNILDHPKLVQDGQTGFLFEPHQPLAIAEAIRKFERLSRSEKETMSRAARAFAERNLSKSRFADEFETLMKQVVAERG